MVAKIVAGLDNGMDDLGLRMLRSEVEYAPVPLHDVKQTYWFPTLATIEVETPKQHWRNTHRFDDYKQFSVNTEEVIAKKP
jgi:competence transcription factor ComK